MGIEFDVVVSGVDEAGFRRLPPMSQAIAAARGKAERVAVRRRRSWVIGCDTVVAIDGRGLGQPAGAWEAAEMLRLLSGRRHSVISAVCVVAPTGVFEATGISQVRFQPLTKRRIAAYVATGEPLGKAGAYAIQGEADRFAKLDRGRFDTVVGLPSHVVRRLLLTAGYPRFANLGRLEKPAG